MVRMPSLISVETMKASVSRTEGDTSRLDDRKPVQTLKTLRHPNQASKTIMNRKDKLSTPVASLLIGSLLTAAVSAGSFTQSMNFTRPSRNMDAIAPRQTTSVVNCTRLESVAGEKVTGGGMSTNTAGTRSAIGTSTITTATKQSPH